MPDFAILESKSTGARGGFATVLRGAGVRPIECSKYCLGVALTRPQVVRGNRFLSLTRRHFLTLHPPSGAEAVTTIESVGHCQPGAG